MTAYVGCAVAIDDGLGTRRLGRSVPLHSAASQSSMRWTNAVPVGLLAQMYEYRSTMPVATVSMSTMTGFDWPFQFASCWGGIDLVPDCLTFSPAIFGRASVAFTMHDLALSAAAQLNAGMNSARIAPLMTVFIGPRLLLSVLHAEIQQQVAPIGNGRMAGIAVELMLNATVENEQPRFAVFHSAEMLTRLEKEYDARWHGEVRGT